jgi:hypothetical protein
VRTGTVVAVSGATYSGGHYTSTTGPCFVIGSGVTNVTIQDNEIGPCGSSQVGSLNTEGVQLTTAGAGNVIQRNVIHDASTGIFSQEGTQNPLTIDRNFFYNMRGPMWQGQAIQFQKQGQGTLGTTGSKITCNTIDDRYGVNSSVEDHISMYDSRGVSDAQPIVIAYNKIRGALVTQEAHQSGSGMMLGDGYAAVMGYFWVHHNTVVETNGQGIGIAGGNNIIVEDNQVANNGAALGTYTGWPYGIQKFSAPSCTGHIFRRNIGQGRLWAYNHTGETGNGLWSDGQCGYTVGTSADSNNWTSPVLPSSIFDATTYSQCN